jgi:hypothetical protein
MIQREFSIPKLIRARRSDPRNIHGLPWFVLSGSRGTVEAAPFDATKSGSHVLDMT